MRSIIIIIITVSAIFARAQHLTPAVIAGSGSDGNAGDYHLSWTLGEVAIATHSQTDATLLQGFHQPNYIFTRLVEDTEKGLRIRLYPNPTTDWITVEVEGLKKDITAELYDIFGRLIFYKKLNPPRTLFDLGGLPVGLYLFKIRYENHEMAGIWKIHKC